MYLFKTKQSILIIVSALLVLSFYGYDKLFTAPEFFPVGKNFIIDEDESLKSISNRLEKENYINSALLFRSYISFIGSDRKVQLGGYSFDVPSSFFGVTSKFTSGKPNMPLIKVTIPEGSTVIEVANLVREVLPNINVDNFIAKVYRVKAEGKLFPSTYFLLPSMTEIKVIEKMTQTFHKKYLSIYDNVQAPVELKSVDEIISLAAILEGEAKTKDDMKIVSGILLKRLEIGMPLQVDVAPETYKKKGLPEYPINNPGLVAIGAVFNRIESPYLYYLTGKDGTMYYAKTFEEHKINIRKYLK